MLSWIGRHLIKNADAVEEMDVRNSWGRLSAKAGIFLNFSLAALKLFAGLMSGSLAVVADAVNNISDAASSVISLISFHLAAQKPDQEHPFGHARIEYLSGLLISVLILMMGFDLFRESISRIMHPKEINVSFLTLGILLISILVKLYMYHYNHRIGQWIHSSALEAAAADSRSDCFSTLAVLTASVIHICTPLLLDGWFGLGGSVYIMFSGIQSLIETANPLLGHEPDADFVDRVRETVLGYQDRGILGMHDLVVHDYGPGHTMISLHVVVPSDGSLMETHTLVDEIEHRLRERVGAEAVIHVDPVDLEDPETIRLYREVSRLIEGMEGDLKFHDFRTIRRSRGLKIMFDVVLPYSYPMTDEEVLGYLTGKLGELSPGAELDIEIDKA